MNSTLLSEVLERKIASNYLWRIQKPHNFYVCQGGIFTGKNTNAWSEMDFFEKKFSSKVKIAESH